MNLIMLPFAGGTASSYNFIKKDISDKINIFIPEIAGRGVRHADKMYEDIDEAVSDIYSQIKLLADDRYIIFGHSMGAVLAYELYNRIAMNKHRLPEAVFVSGGILEKTFCVSQIHLLPDNMFIEAISGLGGIPCDLMENSEILDYIIPFLRNDIRIVDEYRNNVRRKIKCDLYVLNGRDDRLSNSEIMTWEKYSENKPKFYIFTGGHFFINEHYREIAELINKIYEAQGDKMENILRIINKYTDKPIECGSVYTVSLDDIGINSVNYIKIIVELELEFDIEFEDDILTENFPTIGDFIKSVLKKQRIAEKFR